MIFLNSLEMNNEFILFRNEAIWKTSSSFMDEEEVPIDVESKQALGTSRVDRANDEFGQKEDLRIIVVLTSNYYLHLEQEDKIATVKLGEVKLSRKGKEVIVADRGKGIGGILGFKRELGRIIFESTEEVETFASKLSLAMQRLSLK